MPRQRRVVLSSAALGIAIAGVLTGGPPASARTTVRTAFSTVRAVNVDDGEVAAIARVGARSRYSLAVPAGAYLVVFSTIYINGATSYRVTDWPWSDRGQPTASRRPPATAGS